MEAQTTWTALRHSLKINYWSDQKQCWVKKVKKTAEQAPKVKLIKAGLLEPSNIVPILTLKFLPVFL